MTRTLSIVLLAMAASHTGNPSNPQPDPDPTVTDGDKYRVLLENQEVRVLHYQDQPGAKTHLHHHPAFVIYALAPFHRQLASPDGSKRIREFKAGDVAWMPAQSHVGENVGSTPTDALLVEVKPRPAR